MKTNEKRIVESAGSPNENDLWLNGTVLKKFQNGEWVTISGGSDSGGGAIEQVQADWNQTDNTQVDYIKNKPTILATVIVEGTLEDRTDIGWGYVFTPNDGQPTYAEASAAYDAGGAVILVRDFGEYGSLRYSIIGHYVEIEDGETLDLLFGLMQSGTAVNWPSVPLE